MWNDQETADALTLLESERVAGRSWQLQSDATGWTAQNWNDECLPLPGWGFDGPPVYESAPTIAEAIDKALAASRKPL